MQNTLNKFFEYLHNETFEEGYTYFTTQPQTPLTTFCSDFLQAKNIVEISYLYAKARTLYQNAAKSIRSMDEELFIPLAEFADLQAAILKIDRGIYTSYATSMKSAAQELKKKTESLLNIFEQTNSNSTDNCYEIMKKNLVEKVEEDNIYANAILIVAELYFNRWNLGNDAKMKLSRVQDTVADLNSRGNKRLSSDLAPHIHVIKRFQQRCKDQGKLSVKNGEVAFYYYATLNYRVHKEFNDLLLKTTQGDSELLAKVNKLLESTSIIAEEMSDIWSGFNSIEFINTYKLIFNNIKIDHFRNLENLEADVELKYYTMGIFELKISFSVDNMSLSALRHLQSLGTPFALDEHIVEDSSEVNYELFIEYVNTKFQKLNNNIIQLLEGKADVALLPDKQALTYNSEQNRFVLMRINNIVENFTDKVVTLHSQDFKKHCQYKALVMPVREVRSAIDNWIMYDSQVVDKNLASIRYNESEWASVDPYHGTIALLEQPVWVFDQAIESVEVAVAVLNLLKLSNVQATIQLKNIAKTKELEDMKSTLEAEIEQLDEFKAHLINLLETVEAGSMMTYPDHTIFMEEIFHVIALKRQKSKAVALQQRLRDQRAKSMEIIDKINKAETYSQQKVIKLLVSIASVFFALGSLTDIFGLWDHAEFIKCLGYDDPTGNRKLFLVLSLAILSIFWLIYDYYKNNDKG